MGLELDRELEIDLILLQKALTPRKEETYFINNDAQSLFLLSYAASFSGYSVISANRFTVGCDSLRLDAIESEWAEKVLPVVTKEWEEK